MTDLFEEVEEQLRTDRYKQLLRKFLPWMLGGAAALLIAFFAYWGYDAWQTGKTDKASEQYAAAIEAMAAGDRPKAEAAWGEVAKTGTGSYKALALMHLAAFADEAGKTQDAVRLLDDAAKATNDPLIADAARLKSAFAVLDTAPLKDVEGRLKPLMENDRPYRAQAREALAFAKLNAGDLAGARGDFVLLSQSLDASQGAQSRAQAAIGLIDSGSAKAVPALVKATKALPPMMPMMPPPGAPAGPQAEGAAPQ